MYTYKTVLLEIEDKEVLTFKERLGGFLELNPERDALDKVANITNLRVTEDGLFGDIESIVRLDGLYPSIRYVAKKFRDNLVLEGKILSIGFTKERNIDLSIPPIES